MSFERALLENFWHLVCHRRELQHPGDYIRFDVPGGEVVIFNDAGNIVAFDNHCPHRGARIYIEDWGSQAASCKYHGWTYKNGKMIVPDPDSFKNCNIDSAKFNTFRIDWCGDFVFFGVAPKKELYEQLGDVATLLENISFNVDGRHDFSRYQYECYWPFAIENSLEPYHISMVHPETLASLDLQTGENIFSESNSVWYSPVGNKRINKKLCGLKRFFNVDYQYEGYMSIYMFPFTMLSSTFGYSYSLQNFFPVEKGRNLTNFTSRLLTTSAVSDAASQIIKPFFDSTSMVNRKVFEEDHAICKLMPHDSWSSQPLKYPSELEIKIEHFRGLCRNFIK